MRVAFVLLVVGVAILISGCGGGSGSGRSGRGAYFDAIESGFDCGTATPESRTPDPTESIERARHAVETFAALTPPPEIAATHRELADASEAVLDLAANGTTPLPGDASMLDKERAYVTAQANWEEAFASHYGARLFKNEGTSMEPAFHSGDLLAFSPVRRRESRAAGS